MEKLTNEQQNLLNAVKQENGKSIQVAYFAKKIISELWAMGFIEITRDAGIIIEVRAI